jgi:CRP-like cAMP-binding protein
MDSLFRTLDQIHKLSNESKTAFAAITTTRNLPKGSILLYPGAVSSRLFFIKKGIARTFYLKDDKDVTDCISPENTFSASITSYLTHEPDRRCIELLENSTVIEIPRNELDTLVSQYRDIQALCHKWSNAAIVQLQQRFDDFHFATAAERYKKFVDRNPTVVQRIPLGIIASFLGITQETLSRIRAQKFSLVK